MLSKVMTASLTGLDTETVTVEVDFTQGLPAISMVGLPDLTIRESRERIRSALINTGFAFPMKRITINLSPANTRKSGSHFDLPIALGIMASNVGLVIDETVGFLGELSLDGGLKRVAGALPLVIGLKKAGIKKVFIPMGNAKETGLIQDIEIYPSDHLLEISEHFMEGKEIKKFNKGDISNSTAKTYFDYLDVAGQESVKRAFEVSAAGSHNLIMTGPPGVGKSMMAKRIPTILPDLEYEEIVEVSKIYSIAGELTDSRPFITERPFRSPHHTITSAALFGGGNRPRPGEISLAHKGVLFMDEFPEYDRAVLDMLRQPVEDATVTISRVGKAMKYPCEFVLLAAMNPCPCGYYGDPSGKCTCTESIRRRYIEKISGPLLDRIDIHVSIGNVQYCDFKNADGNNGRSSSEIKNRVNSARRMQSARYEKEDISNNSQLYGRLLKKYCHLDDEAESILKTAYEKFSLSARSGMKLMKIARTIADLRGGEEIGTVDMAEAVSYRNPMTSL